MRTIIDRITKIYLDEPLRKETRSYLKNPQSHCEERSDEAIYRLINRQIASQTTPAMTR